MITDVGKHDVEAWLSQPIEPEPHLQTDLFAKVMLSLMLGRSAGLYLDTQRPPQAPERESPGMTAPFGELLGSSW